MRIGIGSIQSGFTRVLSVRELRLTEFRERERNIKLMSPVIIFRPIPSPCKVSTGARLAVRKIRNVVPIPQDNREGFRRWRHMLHEQLPRLDPSGLVRRVLPSL